ncbi:Sec-independent protein translocase protein TatB [Parasphingorhabdus pacifica]
MFDSIGWLEVLVLVVAGLFILGPERLPSGAAWLGRSVRQVKEYATGARDQLQSELGPEFNDLRKPLEDLRGIRNFDPRQAVTKHLFDGENPLHGLTKENGTGSSSRASGAKPERRPERPLQPDERPPYDSDAT